MEPKFQNYTDIFEKIPQTAYIYDLKTLDFIAVNEEAVKKYGYTKEEFLSMNLKDIRPTQDIPRLLQYVNNPEINKYRSAIWRHCKKDGTIFYVKSSSNEINYDGKAARIVLAEDVTQIRNFEQRLYTQYEVVKVIAEFNSTDEVIPKILKAVCLGVEFDVGEFWSLNKQMNHISLQTNWVAEHLGKSSFIQSSNNYVFKKGKGLPGSTWEGGKPVWIENIEENKIFSRKSIAREAGLKTAIAFPVYHHNNFFGVMCFFRFVQNAPDSEILQMFESLGSQIGNFIEKKIIEEEKNSLLIEIANEISYSGEAELAIERKVRQQAAIAELGRNALEGTIPAELIKEAVQLIKDVNGYEYITVLEYLPKENLFLLKAGSGWDKWLIGNVKLEAGEESQAGYTFITGKPVIVNDLRNETRFKKLTLLLDKNIVSGMNVLIHGKGNPFGVLSAHTIRQCKFSDEDAQFLGAIANIIATSIERKKAETELELSVKEKEALLKEVHHRVKNNLQVVSSLLNLQSRLIKDPEALELFNESQTRIKSMALIHEKLYRSKSLLKINFEDYISDLLGNLFESYCDGIVTVHPIIEIKDIYLSVDTAAALGLISNELISNSLKYAFKKETGTKGEIMIRMNTDKNNYCLIVKDNGCGLPENFDFRETSTLGLQLVITLVEQFNGKVEAYNDEGAVFKITFKRPDENQGLH